MAQSESVCCISFPPQTPDHGGVDLLSLCRFSLWLKAHHPPIKSAHSDRSLHSSQPRKPSGGISTPQGDELSAGAKAQWEISRPSRKGAAIGGGHSLGPWLCASGLVTPMCKDISSSEIDSRPSSEVTGKKLCEDRSHLYLKACLFHLYFPAC